MKFIFFWLKKYLEIDVLVVEIVDILIDLGLEVEDIVNLFDCFGLFILVKVMYVEQYFDVDCLWVCIVEIDEGDKQIVCGVFNVCEGIIVVLCKLGDYVFGLDIILLVGKICGVESYGMMVLECELELLDEYNGIIELLLGEVGQKFVDWLVENDLVLVDLMIEIVIMLNCGDVFGVCGIVCDLVVCGFGVFKLLEVEFVFVVFESDIKVIIDDDIIDGCLVFCGCLIKGVKNGLLLEWFQQVLIKIGLCLISFFVDVINYFIYDLNCFLYVFDVDKVVGNLWVYCVKGGEEIVVLDEKIYILLIGVMVIFDDNGVESIVGIMGGEVLGCIEEIVNVFVESVWWDLIQIVYMGCVLKINFDVWYWFECLVDFEFIFEGLEYVVCMIVDYVGGEVFEMVVVGVVFDFSWFYKLNVVCV